MLRGPAEHADGMMIGRLLARRVGDRIAADATVIRCQEVDVRELLATRTFDGERVTPRLVVKADLAPGLRPVIAIEARKRGHDPLRVVRTDMVERIGLAGAA